LARAGLHIAAGAHFSGAPAQQFSVRKPSNAFMVSNCAEVKGAPAEVALAFKDAYRMLYQRIGIFTALPLRSLDQLRARP
jgi:hypothetical protein